MVTLKLSETRDGYAAGDQHDPRLMITGAAANARTHMERAQHDAIMVGIGTILADDPLMNVRLPGLEARRPVRIVLDTHLRIPLGSRLVATARDYPTWIFTGNAPDPDKMQALQGRGLEILPVAIGADGHLALGSALQTMAQRGLTRIFSEGGPSIAAALIAAGFADECLLFTRTTPLGRPGVEALSVAAREKLNDPVRYHLSHDGFAGPDRMRVYQRELG